MTHAFKLAASAAAVLSLFGCGAGAPEETIARTSSQGTRALQEPAMPVLDDNVRISAGLVNVAALHADGTVYTWGGNQYGQLGRAASTTSPIPNLVRGLSSVVALQSGGYHVAAIRIDGTVWTWGNNTYGQLGLPTGLSSVNATPQPVPGMSRVVSVAAGYAHSAAVTSTGSLWGWGSMPGRNSKTPVRVDGLPAQVTKVRAGSDFNLALGADGFAYAWGSNRSGQLGNGQFTTVGSTPSRVVNLSNVVDISAGTAHALALSGDGQVWAWGSNANGQLGTGGASENVARPVPGLPTALGGAAAIKAIIAGGRNSAVVYRDGSVWIWGSNASGQLGTGSTITSTVPQRLNALAGVAALTVGENFVSVLKSDGTVYSIGANHVGQLGNNSLARSAVPVQVVGMSGGGYINLGASAAK